MYSMGKVWYSDCCIHFLRICRSDEAADESLIENILMCMQL